MNFVVDTKRLLVKWASYFLYYSVFVLQFEHRPSAGCLAFLGKLNLATIRHVLIDDDEKSTPLSVD